MLQNASEVFKHGLQALLVRNGAWYRPVVVASPGVTLTLRIGRAAVLPLQSSSLSSSHSRELTRFFKKGLQALSVRESAGGILFGSLRYVNVYADTGDVLPLLLPESCPTRLTRSEFASGSVLLSYGRPGRRCPFEDAPSPSCFFRPF